MKRLAAACLVAVVLTATSARAATLKVGPGGTYAGIMDAWAVVEPGDVIEVQGGQTYTGTFLLDSGHSGTAAQPITLRGIPVDGQRPVLRGIGPGTWDNMVVLLNADHFVMESFEIVGDDDDSAYCLVHEADDVTLRDLVVHDCLHQAGLVGNDDGSGSLTLEYSEFFDNGSGEYSHQIYMATDQAMYPGSTFRMQHCYVHDGVGGNNVVSRAERNEIDYNWIEGAYYHELDLRGPDVGGSYRPCNSDVVGNVFVKSSPWRVARIGGDSASSSSNGQYRFVNNTMVLADVTKAAIGLQFAVRSVEMYNNVLVAPKPGAEVYDVNDPMGAPAVWFGSNNWLVEGMAAIPTPWTRTLTGAVPGFVDAATADLRPLSNSPLANAGTTATVDTGAAPFPSPLLLPAFNPPERRLIPVGSAEPRTLDGAPSIGAFEPNAAPPGASAPSAGGGPVTSADGDGGGRGTPSGCACRTSPERDGSLEWLAGLTLACLAVARRPRRGRACQ